MSPVERSMKHLRGAGWTVCVVERFNRFACVRQDAFGFGDLLAVRAGQIALIQTTTASNMAARRKKILSLDGYGAWKAGNGLCILHGWRAAKRGRRKVWEVSEELL